MRIDRVKRQKDEKYDPASPITEGFLLRHRENHDDDDEAQNQEISFKPTFEGNRHEQPDERAEQQERRCPAGIDGEWENRPARA